MSEEDLICTKSRILEIFAELDNVELDSIEQWISSQSYMKGTYFIIIRFLKVIVILKVIHQRRHYNLTISLLDLTTKRNLKNGDKKLIKIGNAIKKMITFEAEMSSENIMPPTVGVQADCNNINTCHVDEFLYDQEEVEVLVKSGKLKRHYCLDCNSRNIKVCTLHLYVVCFVFINFLEYLPIYIIYFSGFDIHFSLNVEAGSAIYF